jgi:hypothetical protein
MMLNGCDYLLRLSILAVSFVGWSAIVVTLRRALGAELSALHMYFVRFFIEAGLAVAAFGLMPGALSLTGLADTTIWRLSSAAAALMFSAYPVSLYRRRRHVMPGPMQPHARVAYACTIMAALALWVNTVGLGFRPNVAAYALPLTWLLVLGGWVFVRNLVLFFNETPAQVSPQGESPHYRSPFPSAPTVGMNAILRRFAASRSRAM